MENRKKGFFSFSRSTGLIVICVGLLPWFFFAMIEANISKDISLIEQVCDLLELNQSQGYAILSLVILLTGSNLCFAYLLFRGNGNNKANQNDTKDNPKTYSSRRKQISDSHCSDYCSKAIEPAIFRTDDHLLIPDIIRCLDEDCTGILGLDRKCSDCGKSF